MRRSPAWLTERPFAHRGLHNGPAGIAENTLPAVDAAIAAGYGIEIDVRASADGEAIVFHDATLERMTEASGRLADRAARELVNVPFRIGPAGMPTLPDLLALVAGRAPLLVEIKSDGPGNGRLERRVAALLADYSGPAAVQSFEPAVLRTFARLAPSVPRGIISMAYTDPQSRARYGPLRRLALRHLLHAPSTRPHFVAYDVDALPALAPLLLRRLGVPLLTWTVRDAGQRACALRWADQSIFENSP